MRARAASSEWGCTAKAFLYSLGLAISDILAVLSKHVFSVMQLKEAIVDVSAEGPQHQCIQPPRKIPFLQFFGLSRHDDIIHAVYTRHGGVSSPPFQSLNTGFNIGDSLANVEHNLEIIKTAIGTVSLCAMHQVHGTEVIALRSKDPLDLANPLQGDALITDIKHLALMVKQADCQAVILFDPIKKVISNIHCGWRGNAKNILGVVVNRMKSEFGCKTSHILAAIGPSLGPCCAEFVTHRKIFPDYFRSFMVRPDYFDLWQISRFQLLQVGLQEQHIEIAGICTRCRTDLFYSYRAEGTTGRFATLVMMQ